MKANIQFLLRKNNWSDEVIENLDYLTEVENANAILPPENGVYRYGERRFTVDEIEYAYGQGGSALIKVFVLEGVSARRKFAMAIPFPPY